MASIDAILEGVNVLGTVREEHRKILTPPALAFLAQLHRSFNDRRKALLERRKQRQAEIDKGVLPDFLPETRHVREDHTWRGAPPAPGLVDRRVEITGPTDRKMVVNALNSNVWTYMADFEGKQQASGQGKNRQNSDHSRRRPLNRLERPHLGQHDQRPGEPVRRGAAAGRLQAGE